MGRHLASGFAFPDDEQAAIGGGAPPAGRAPGHRAVEGDEREGANAFECPYGPPPFAALALDADEQPAAQRNTKTQDLGSRALMTLCTSRVLPRQVVDAATQRRQLRVVGLRNVDVERIVDGNDEV